MKRGTRKVWMSILGLALIVMLLPGVATEAATKKVSSISISNVTNKKLTLEKGNTYQLKATIKPTNATNTALKWTSTNEKVVTVTSSGKLTAKKNGTAKIKATAKDGSKKSVTITVTVGTRVKSVKMNSGNQTLLVGESLQLKTTVSPSKASNKELIYSSSNSKVVSVSSKGVIKAVALPSGAKTGSATITVKSTDGSKAKATIKVKVERPVSKITVKQKTVYLDKNESAKAIYSVSPETACTKDVAFSTSNSKVATVSSTGVIQSTGYGTAKITVKSVDGSKVSNTITVNVIPDITKITVSSSVQKLLVDETYTIRPVISPSTAAGTKILYTSSNSKVVTVSESGVVKAIGSGTATVTLTADDETKKTATMKFEVKTSSQVSISYKNFAAHMGLNKVAPSNSLPAFVKAGQSGGFMGIETDVRETKDGYFVLYHDEDISTRTNLSGKISQMTLAQVLTARMNVGSNISLYSDLQIPTLEEYLYACKVHGVKPVLHIKSVTNYNKFITSLKNAGMYERAIVTGSKAAMTAIRNLDKKIELYWLCNMTVSGIDWAAANNIHINSDYTYVTQELVEYAHSKNLVVGAWTVNSEKTARSLIYKGVDFITTDYQWVKK